jgi:acyl carrier protein
MSLRKTLAPKVQGTWALGNYFQKRELDFFCLFSSAVTLISGVSVSDYTAANAYLDSYVHYAALRGQKLSVINWATWENIGLSSGEEVDDKKQLLKILPVNIALEILFNLLQKDIRRVAVGKLNYESDLIYLGDYLPLNFSEDINKRNQDKFELVEKQIKQVKLKGREDDNYTDIELKLASIWSEVLGYEEIDIRDNFFELGGDSLSGIRLIGRVNKKLNRGLSFREILQYPSLKELASYVSGSSEVDYKPTIKKVEPKQYKIK